MGTRSRIAIKRKDGSYDSVYCHYDGYPSHNGELLKNYYNDAESAEKIIKLGDLSFLDKRLEPVGKHSFDSPEKGTTIAYGRDRGEKNVDSVHDSNKSDFLSTCRNTDAEYIYVWDTDKWNTFTPDELNKIEESVKVNESITRSILNKLNEADDRAAREARYEAKKKAIEDFSKTIDPEPLFNKIREMVGDNSLQFKFEVEDYRGTLYPRVKTDNVVDKCGIFQLAIKECYIGTFSTGIAFDDKAEEAGDWSQPYWWGSIDLSYSSHSGGSNGMEILRFVYNGKGDGQWDFNESRK